MTWHKKSSTRPRPASNGMNLGMNEVRVRFPPSPTGYCHVGTARMAILNYLFARKHKGTIVFRSEDTDRERSKGEYEADIIDSLHWIGLDWDEFYRQSERTEIYSHELDRLVSEKSAYISEEESKKEPGKMLHVVRLKNPGTLITFTDLIRGDITFDTRELGDFVIARSLSEALYHFAVVVDDALMRITHVIRGDDHISNTPRQILIQEALGVERPLYAHYPLHLGSDRAKLSKRTGDVSVRSYREAGFLPQALLNYVATLGWTPPSGKEILSLGEMVQEFDISDVHKSGAVFDIEKLRWFNRQYLLQMPREEFEATAQVELEKYVAARKLLWDPEIGRKLAPIVHERISVWSDVGSLVTNGEFDYFFSDPTLVSAKIPEKGSGAGEARRHLTTLHDKLSAAEPEIFSLPERLKDAVWEYATHEGRGKVLWPLRYALSGKERSPDPFVIASVIGRDAALRRIDAAIAAL
ncbi:MAG: Glutamate-tRNA ligase [Parcubacteria group bacterium GW2011_GWA2_51_10]|nr:MAG: Glutamate-tRNA ligase [Parcubacteria group bacterium GW2011_GWA2_51_10]